MVETKVLLDRHELLSVINTHKGKGQKIVLTNGCFDLIHVGHMRCLKGAKEEGDILIVGVNSDASMRALGKQGRPLMPENERLEILSAIIYIDYLTLFSEPTVDNLLQWIRPDVFAKGTDYTEENIPERKTALSINARIAIVGDPKNHSSTAYLKKIQGLSQ